MKDKKDSTINIRIDSELKKEAESIIEELGLSTSSAVVLFFKAVIRQRGLPFEIRLPKEKKKERPDIPSTKPITKKVGKRKKNERKEGSLTMLNAIERL